jgi:hypothetical protein
MRRGALATGADEAGSRPAGGSPRRVVVGSALAVLVLLAVVAVAATGSTPSGTGQSSAPGDTLFDTVVSLLIVGALAALAIGLYALLFGKNLEWSAPRRRYGITSLVVFLAFAFAIVVYVRARGLNLGLDPQQTPLDRPESTIPPPSLGTRGGAADHEFRFAWLPVLVVAVLAGIGVAAFVVSSRRRKPDLRAPLLADELAGAIDLSLDDLRAEADPRRAVIAAYARLEHVLAAHGQPRRRADTPEEHVSRALSTLDVDTRAVHRLEELYVGAMFSQHAIDADMKDAAIGALERVRDDLRSAGSRDAVPVGAAA